ncbi:MAG: S-layer homology domain-containing protein [Oscillospiraceae bacterium]
MPICEVWISIPSFVVSEAVDYVLANGIMEGMGNQKFAPNVGLTRGMLIKFWVPWQAWTPRAYEAHSFQDVPASAWYAPYVEWACQNGLARGYGDNRFAPNRLVSREEMVTFLYRFWQLQGGSWTVDDTAYRAFGPGPGLPLCCGGDAVGD